MITETGARAAAELSRTLTEIKEEQVEAMMGEVCQAKKIYVMGAGRSMLMLRCFAMRLMHLGFESYVVGDTTTPAFEKGDLLICGSGSGETQGVVNVARKAKELGGRIATITIQADSSLGKLSDAVIEVPAYTDKRACDREEKPVLLGGSLFEQSILVLSDAMVLPLARKAGIPTDRAFSRHANLE